MDTDLTELNKIKSEESVYSDSNLNSESDSDSDCGNNDSNTLVNLNVIQNGNTDIKCANGIEDIVDKDEGDSMSVANNCDDGDDFKKYESSNLCQCPSNPVNLCLSTKNGFQEQVTKKVFNFVLYHFFKTHSIDFFKLIS